MMFRRAFYARVGGRKAVKIYNQVNEAKFFLRITSGKVKGGF